MSLNFRVVEQETVPYETLKQAYLNGIRGKKLMEMYGMGSSQYTRLLRDFREDGIVVPRRGNTSINENTKWYSHQGFGRYTYWVVKRTINGQKYTFGRYKTEAEAQKKVEELKKNNWNGLLK